MGSHRYTNVTNPFDEDDVDDETFLAGARRSPAAALAAVDEQVQSLQQRRNQIESRTIASSERSIGILRDSEQIGIATAEELARQREQLERTDKRLDEINQTLRFSQKHINGIKSVFSSLKSYVSGRREASAASTPVSQPPLDRFESHPVTRLRNLPADVVDEQQARGGSQHISARLEANLSEMSSSISRLKGLAADLGGEIDSQNDLIEGITYKSEAAEMSIQKQNKDMNRLLGRK